MLSWLLIFLNPEMHARQRISDSAALCVIIFYLSGIRTPEVIVKGKERSPILLPACCLSSYITQNRPQIRFAAILVLSSLRLVIAISLLLKF
jgi:hypothetical protein